MYRKGTYDKRNDISGVGISNSSGFTVLTVQELRGKDVLLIAVFFQLSDVSLFSEIPFLSFMGRKTSQLNTWGSL